MHFFLTESLFFIFRVVEKVCAFLFLFQEENAKGLLVEQKLAKIDR